MRKFAEASREVDATDCAADGNPRELLQRQRARVEALNELLQDVKVGLPIAVDFPLVVEGNHVASYPESLVANGQIARVQLAARVAERQKLIRNARAAFRTSED